MREWAALSLSAPSQQLCPRGSGELSQKGLHLKMEVKIIPTPEPSPLYNEPTPSSCLKQCPFSLDSVTNTTNVCARRLAQPPPPSDLKHGSLVRFIQTPHHPPCSQLQNQNKTANHNPAGVQLIQVKVYRPSFMLSKMDETYKIMST